MSLGGLEGLQLSCPFGMSMHRLCQRDRPFWHVDIGYAKWTVHLASPCHVHLACLCTGYAKWTVHLGSPWTVHLPSLRHRLCQVDCPKCGRSPWDVPVSFWPSVGEGLAKKTGSTWLDSGVRLPLVSDFIFDFFKIAARGPWGSQGPSSGCVSQGIKRR